MHTFLSLHSNYQEIDIIESKNLTKNIIKHLKVLNGIKKILNFNDYFENTKLKFSNKLKTIKTIRHVAFMSMTIGSNLKLNFGTLKFIQEKHCKSLNLEGLLLKKFWLKQCLKRVPQVKILNLNQFNPARENSYLHALRYTKKLTYLELGSYSLSSSILKHFNHLKELTLWNPTEEQINNLYFIPNLKILSLKNLTSYNPKEPNQFFRELKSTKIKLDNCDLNILNYFNPNNCVQINCDIDKKQLNLISTKLSNIYFYCRTERLDKFDFVKLFSKIHSPIDLMLIDRDKFINDIYLNHLLDRGYFNRTKNLVMTSYKNLKIETISKILNQKDLNYFRYEAEAELHSVDIKQDPDTATLLDYANPYQNEFIKEMTKTNLINKNYLSVMHLNCIARSKRKACTTIPASHENLTEMTKTLTGQKILAFKRNVAQEDLLIKDLSAFKSSVKPPSYPYSCILYPSGTHQVNIQCQQNKQILSLNNHTSALIVTNQKGKVASSVFRLLRYKIENT
jgi:hypothetical protein